MTRPVQETCLHRLRLSGRELFLIKPTTKMPVQNGCHDKSQAPIPWTIANRRTNRRIDYSESGKRGEYDHSGEIAAPGPPEDHHLEAASYLPSIEHNARRIVRNGSNTDMKRAAY